MKTRSPGVIPAIPFPPTEAGNAAQQQFFSRIAHGQAAINAASIVEVVGLGSGGAGDTGPFSGSVILTGSNNVTISGSSGSNNQNTIVVSGPTLLSIGVTNSGSSAGTTGAVASRYAIVASRNLTASQSVSGNSATLTLLGPDLTAGIYASSNTTGQSSSTTVDIRSLTFRGMGAVSVGASASEVIISAPNTVAQTAQTVGVYGVGNTTGQSSSSTYDARTVSIHGAGAASVGNSGGSVIVSVPVQTNQSLGVFASSNTTAQSSSSTFDARSLTIRGAGGVSVGASAGEIVISGASPGAGGGIALAAGTQTAETGTVVFSASNGLAFGMSNSSVVTGSYTVPVSGTGPADIAAVSGNGTNTSQFAMIDHVHRGVAKVNIYANPTDAATQTTNFYGNFSIHAGGNITFSTGGTADSHGAITMYAASGGGAGLNRSAFEIMAGDRLVTACPVTHASLSKRPILIPFWMDGENLSCKTVRLYGSRPAGTTLNMTMGVAFYSMANSTQISLATSTTHAYSLTASSLWGGIRVYDITGLSAFTLSEGRWILGLYVSGSNNSTAVMNLNFLGGDVMPVVAGSVHPGSNSSGATNDTNHFFPFWGVYSNTTAAFPGSIARTQVFGANSNVARDVYAALLEI